MVESYDELGHVKKYKIAKYYIGEPKYTSCPVCGGIGEYVYPGGRLLITCCFCEGNGEVKNKVISGTRIC